MFDDSIKFKYSWRPYQAKVLEEVNGLIKDKKVTEYNNKTKAA